MTWFFSRNLFILSKQNVITFPIIESNCIRHINIAINFQFPSLKPVKRLGKSLKSVGITNTIRTKHEVIIIAVTIVLYISYGLQMITIYAVQPNVSAATKSVSYIFGVISLKLIPNDFIS